MSLSTEDMSCATGLTLRQIQYAAKKNLIHSELKANEGINAERLETIKEGHSMLSFTQQVGRGNRYGFDNDDIIRFSIVREAMRFNLTFERIYLILSKYFYDIIKKPDVKKYLKGKMFLKNKHFLLWCEHPSEGQYEDVYGYLIDSPDKPFPSTYFVKAESMVTEPKFNGFKFEPGSNSALIIDLGAIYKNRHNFLQQHTKLIEKKKVQEKKVVKSKLKS